MDDIDGDEKLNVFRVDACFEKSENEWDEIKREILGDENIIRLKTR
jgi:pre-mRNA-splicing factor CWC22